MLFDYPEKDFAILELDVFLTLVLQLEPGILAVVRGRSHIRNKHGLLAPFDCEEQRERKADYENGEDGDNYIKCNHSTNLLSGNLGSDKEGIGHGNYAPMGICS